MEENKGGFPGLFKTGDPEGPEDNIILEPTLEDAVFKGTNAFSVKDYIHGGENEKLKKDMISIGRSW